MSTPETKEFKIEISADLVRQYIQEALIKALSPPERDRLVTEAIHKLLAGQWDRTSEISRVFQQAANDVCRTLAETEMRKPDFMAKFEAIVSDGFKKAFEEDGRKKLVDKVAENIGRGLFGRDY